MSAFQIGDHVRISDSVLGSEFLGRTGIVVAVESRRSGTMKIIECEVEFSDEARRWFLGFQLVRLTAAPASPDEP